MFIFFISQECTANRPKTQTLPNCAQEITKLLSLSKDEKRIHFYFRMTINSFVNLDSLNNLKKLKSKTHILYPEEQFESKVANLIYPKISENESPQALQTGVYFI